MDKQPLRLLDTAAAHVEINKSCRHNDITVARKNCPRVDLAAGAHGTGGSTGLEHGAEGGGRWREPGSRHAAEDFSDRGAARVTDVAGEERVPSNGVARGHFVEQAGGGAWEAGFCVGGEEGGGRDGAGEGR